MFFIQFGENDFIDGERICLISINDEEIGFRISGCDETFFVRCGFESVFVNNVQALNCNFNIEGHYHNKIKDK